MTLAVLILENENLLKQNRSSGGNCKTIEFTEKNLGKSARRSQLAPVELQGPMTLVMLPGTFQGMVKVSLGNFAMH